MAIKIKRYRGIVGCIVQPEDKEVLWLDISNSSKPVLKVYIDGEWLKLAGGDKEIQISGGGNIRELVNLGALKPKSLTLNYATRLTNLDLSYSTKLLSLALKNNTYLQSLDCTGAIQLGTEASGAQLYLSNCVNLKDIKLDRTKLTSVVFPIGGALK